MSPSATTSPPPFDVQKAAERFAREAGRQRAKAAHYKIALQAIGDSPIDSAVRRLAREVLDPEDRRWD